jgi:ribosomal protein S18 acetylase RimI-like enzyme
MLNFTIRNLTPDDIPHVMELQYEYQKVYSSASIIPGEVYLSSGFDDGKNIFCAFDGKGYLQGYAPLFPNLTENPQIPHTVWAEVKVNPELASPQGIKDLLFERVVGRTREITSVLSNRPTRLTFQYHPSETASIEFVTSKGCAHTESVFRMIRDLSQELPAIHQPEGIEVRAWHTDDENEQIAYVQARNKAFPDSPIALADWQYFLSSPAWREGTSITAFDRDRIAGSVIVYWDEAISRQTGRKAGFTENIFVGAEWRKCGIASFLIRQGLIYLKEHGREAAFLEVKASNQNALDLYTRLEYQLIDETRLYVLEL